MRLLKVEQNGAFSLVDYFGDVPSYAILSHTWGQDNEEITFEDIQNGNWACKPGLDKLRFCQRQAAKDNLYHCWIDTCCIDKKSATELAEAINSMFRWYRKATRCYAYLSDVSSHDDTIKEQHSQNRWKSMFKKSRWFKRGWTLQELIAPQSIDFFSREGTRLGDRSSLEQTIHEVTSIPTPVLQGKPLTQYTVNERLSWIRGRETKREEDMAYSMLGILDIFLPLIYGEGLGNATQRLRSAIAESFRTDPRSQDILQWLAAPDPSVNYEKALKARQPGTGLWFLSGDLYTQWKNQPGAVWLHVIPGCGKTILSSTILENVLQYTYNNRTKKVAYFYFDFNDQQKQRSQQMVRCLISQLAQGPAKPLAELDALHSSCKGGQQQPSLVRLLEVLHQLVKANLHTYVILDALDESVDRDELLETVQGISAWHVDGLHLLLTSRLERDIEEALINFVNSKGIVDIQSDVVDRDIEIFVRHRLAEDKQLRKWQNEEAVRRDIQMTLMKGARGMSVCPFAKNLRSANTDRFRWAACQLDTLRKCRNELQLYAALRTLPPTLDATYDRMLRGIKEEDVEYALRILRWLVFSSRSMRLAEVAEIVAIDVDRTPAYDKREILKDPSDVLDMCSSLITIAGTDKSGQECVRKKNAPGEPVVLLAHYSVKEYLVSKRICNNGSALYAMQSDLCHEFIARCCIKYLHQHILEHGLRMSSSNDHSLAYYAAREWISHAQAAGDQTKLRVDIHGFLEMNDNSLSTWLRMYNPDKPWEKWDSSSKLSLCATRLYYAAGAGFSAVADRLISDGADVNAQGGEYGNALQAASFRGHEQVVRLLLNRGAEINAKGGKYGNAVRAALYGGYEQMVQLLLNKGADVNAPERYYGNALYIASSKGYKQIAQLLLNKGADVNAPGGYYGNALQAASSEGHKQITQLLLHKGANVNSQGGHYGNALQAASSRGYEQITQLLLEKGADVNAQGGHYGNALQAASFRDHEQIVQLLLNKGADVNAPGGYYGNALQAASSGGHEHIIELLLNKGANINAQGGEYGNALQAASSGGYEQITQLLLKNGADVNAQGGHYGNALQAASSRGHEQIVQLLLSMGADFNAQSEKYGNALQVAYSRGHKQIMQLLEEAGAFMSSY